MGYYNKLLLFTLLILSLSFFVQAEKTITCSNSEFTGDGVVNVHDLLKVRQCYNLSSSDMSSIGEPCLTIDFNGNAIINDFELGLVRYFYLEECSSSQKNLVCSDVDLTGDGVVNIYDLQMVSQCYNLSSSELSSTGESCSLVDINGDLFIDAFEEEIVRYFYLDECGGGSTSYYILTSDFRSIKYQDGSLEEGANADVVDFLSTLFDGFYDGAFARYSIIDSSYDPDLFVAIAEFDDDISFNEFEESYVEYIDSLSDYTFDYEPVTDIDEAISGDYILVVEENIDENMRVNYVWVSHGKFVLVSFEDLRSIEGMSERREDLISFLSAYLQKHVSTLEYVDDSNDGDDEESEEDSGLNLKMINIGVSPTSRDFIPGESITVVADFESEGLEYGTSFFINTQVYNMDGEEVEGCGVRSTYQEGDSQNNYEGYFINFDCDLELYESGRYLFVTELDSEYTLSETDESDNVIEKTFYFGSIESEKETLPMPGSEPNGDNLEQLCDGCYRDDKCYSLGFRTATEYCDVENGFVRKKSSESGCNNNYECESNLCVSGECVDEGLIKRILNWFKNLFGF